MTHAVTKSDKLCKHRFAYIDFVFKIKFCDKFLADHLTFWEGVGGLQLLQGLVFFRKISK